MIGAIRQLAAGYTSEVDTVDEATWYEILETFEDGNIYQTWAWGLVNSGRGRVSHFVLKKDGVVAAVAQVRLAYVPGVGVGVAYMRWGPVWRRNGNPHDFGSYRQAVRAIRNEFAIRRRFVVRLLPNPSDVETACRAEILAEEGYTAVANKTQSNTILMDLTPSVEQLRGGMRPHWKRELKIAERKGLHVIEGSGDDLFEVLVRIHGEMVARKRFVEGSDINSFREAQTALPEQFKMRVMLCMTGETVCAGLVYSAIGQSAIYHFGATSNSGMKSNGSYLLHWRLVQKLKEQGRRIYDLNGINPLKNPGTYKFKADLAGANGVEVASGGQFESYDSVAAHWLVRFAESVRDRYRRR